MNQIPIADAHVIFVGYPIWSTEESEMAEFRRLDTGKGEHDPEAPGVGEMLLANYKVHD